MIKICNVTSEVTSEVFAKHVFAIILYTNGLYITIDVALRNCTSKATDQTCYFDNFCLY